MRAALISGGVVESILIVESLGVMPGLVAGGTAKIGDLWDGVRFTTPAMPAEKIKEIAIREGLESSVGGDAIIKSLKGMDQTEFDAWWTANVTNAAQAIGLLKRLVRMLLLRVL